MANIFYYSFVYANHKRKFAQFTSASYVGSLFVDSQIQQLQNFRCAFSVGVWSHLLKSLLVYAPHIFELYNRIGEIILSKTLMAILGGSELNGG